MTSAPYLRPTLIQGVRAFFSDLKDPVPPWAGFDEVLDHLWMILYERRDDPVFWDRLSALLAGIGRDLNGAGGRGLPDPQAEILSPDVSDEVMERLRAAVRAGPGRPRQEGGRGLPAALGAPLAACLILVGAALATGCNRGGKAPAEPTPEQYVEKSGLPEGSKQALRTCLSRMDSPDRSDLVRLFETRAPEEVAAELEAMLAPGGPCGPEPGIEEEEEEGGDEAAAQESEQTLKPKEDESTDAAAAGEAKTPKETKKKKKVKKMAPAPVPVYKGVTFE